MTRALIGIIVVVSLIALAAIAAVIVVTVQLTEKLDDAERKSSASKVMSEQQVSTQTCERAEDVAIVGAGIAGSYAAWRMRNEGLSVSLYEYSDRIGGRCHTVKFPGIPDVNVEMGAMRFRPLEHPLLDQATKDLGLNVVDFVLGYGGGGDTLYYVRGKHLKYDELAANAPYHLHPDHRIDPNLFQWQLFKNYTDVDSSVSGYSAIQNKLFIKSKDGVPLYKQSRHTFYAKYFTTDTEQYLKDIGALDIAFVDNTAANRLPRSDPALPKDTTPNPVKTVESGFQSIPETMVDRFLKASSRHRLHRNHHLRSLVKNKDGHYVLTFQPTQTVRGVTEDYMSLPKLQTCAKKVLLAIPRKALEHLDWDALKHPDILDLIQNSLMEAKAGKMYFAYGDTWWRNLPLASPYAISSTPLRQTYDYAVSPSTGKGVLNPGYPSLCKQLFKNYTDVDSSVSGYSAIQNKLFIKSKDGIPLYKQSRQTFYAKYFTTDTEQYLKDIGAWDIAFVDNTAANRLPRSDPALPKDTTPNPVKTVESGFQSIPETMVDRFLKASSRHRLHRNHHLRSLVKNKDGHYVLTFQPTQTLRGVTKDYMSLPKLQTCAKKVLLAIPRKALEHLDWDTLKHPDISDLIQNSLMEAKAGKMYFAYGDTWWRNLPLASPYAISSTPLRQTYDYAVSPSTGKGVLNPGYPSLYTKIWRDVQRQGDVVPGVDDDTMAMTNVGVEMARNIYAEIFNVSVSDVQQPDYAVMGFWDKYPIGASWYLWRAGYIWEDVENKMTRPSLDDDVFIISNTFSKTLMQGWVEGALEMVERTFAKYFPGV